jgi:hypothetical protein
MKHEDELRKLLKRSEETIPGEPLQWGDTIARAKKERRLRLTMAAAGLTVLVGAAVLVVPGLIDQTDRGHTPPAATITSEESPSEAAPTALPEPPEAGVIRSGVRDWFTALGRGDARGAWARMSQPARDYYGDDFQTFKNEMSAVAEGYGAWGGADPEIDVRILVSADLEATAVATIYGDVTKEGVSDFMGDAVGVRLSGDEVYVDAPVDSLDISFIEPSRIGQTYEPIAPLTFKAEVPSDVTQVNFFVAGVDSPTRDAEMEKMEKIDSQPPNSIASFRYVNGLNPGEYVLTIVVLDQNGGTSTRTTTFRVST